LEKYGVPKAMKKAWERKVGAGLPAIWGNVEEDRMVDEVYVG
jgi:hypothetical protein